MSQVPNLRQRGDSKGFFLFTFSQAFQYPASSWFFG